MDQDNTMEDPIMPPSDSNGFDTLNDFEKVDTVGPNDGEVSSSTNMPADEDLYSSPNPVEADIMSQPLLSFDSPEKPSPPVSVPDSSVGHMGGGESIPAVKPETIKPEKPTESWLKKIDPRVLDLIYWRDPKKTGVVFGSMLVLLLSLALFSVLSVVAYLSLAALTVTISFRIYKNVLGAVQKSGEGNPFKPYLDIEIELPEEKLHTLADHVMKHVTTTLKELRRLFFVQDLIDSLKFGLLLWALTYIGAWFNGMTLLILSTIAIFTLPKVYETHKTQIDQYLDVARTKVNEVLSKIKEKLPLPGKKKTA